MENSDVTATPLSGGVSCEIVLIEHARKKFVIKRALNKLKVKDDWFADVGRNKTEQDYLRYVDGFFPGVVPKIYYSNSDQCFFCMELLEGDLSNWKTQLLESSFNLIYAKQAGEVLAKIHKHSWLDESAKKTFNTLKDFKALRIQPYLVKTADRNPDLAGLFNAEAERLAATRLCLVHGDFSPKNILVSADRFVFLDCEVAWFGDPVFDLAFLLNHFMLKAARAPENKGILLQHVVQAYAAYHAGMQGLFTVERERQLCQLLPMLMLARVDGKSPVEYLDKYQQERVKQFSYQMLLLQPVSSLAELISQWDCSLSAPNKFTESPEIIADLAP